MLPMARDGLSALVGAGVLAGAVSVLSPLLTPSPALGEERETPIATTLAVQTALQQGREHLLRGNHQAAVAVLESQLARINGSREYLATLRDAYRGYIKELRLANREAEAEEYLKRLRILDPGATLDGAVARGANPEPSPKAPGGEPGKAAPTARAKIDDDPARDPFRPENAVRRDTPGPLEQARQEFRNHHFEAAGRHFDQASRADQNLAADSKEEWGYCKLHQVVEQLNHPPAGGPPYPDLEREVRVALGLAPGFEQYGKGLLAKIEERRAAAGSAGPAPEQAQVAVRHLDRQPDGWAVAETANFRIFHNQPREVAERVAQVAERTRSAMQRKWFGEGGEDWNPRCDLYLHASAQDYSQVTGVPGNSPGHSTIRSDGGRVISRRMDLRCDEPNMIPAVLPHETTHVVIAGRFGEAPVPRWADEGLAVLTEPRDKIERHLVKLPQYRQDRQLFSLRQLMQLNDYPDPRYIGSFYAESVSLVDFLAREKGPQTFSQFLREGLRGGYEPALRRHYGIADFNELEQRWLHATFGDPMPAGVADRR
jgi:hypothetical protein